MLALNVNLLLKRFFIVFFCRNTFRSRYLTKLCTSFTCHTLQRLRLEINIFNLANSNSAFFYKTGLIWVVILYETMAVQLFFQCERALALVNRLRGIQCTLIYSFLYGTGFAVPRRSQRLVSVLRQRLAGNGRVGWNNTEFAYLVKKLRSIRIKGFSVASFHYLQRASIPLFLDFALKHTVRSIIIMRWFKVEAS